MRKSTPLRSRRGLLWHLLTRAPSSVTRNEQGVMAWISYPWRAGTSPSHSHYTCTTTSSASRTYLHSLSFKSATYRLFQSTKLGKISKPKIIRVGPGPEVLLKRSVAESLDRLAADKRFFGLLHLAQRFLPLILHLVNYPLGFGS